MGHAIFRFFFYYYYYNYYTNALTNINIKFFVVDRIDKMDNSNLWPTKRGEIKLWAQQKTQRHHLNYWDDSVVIVTRQFPIFASQGSSTHEPHHHMSYLAVLHIMKNAILLFKYYSINSLYLQAFGMINVGM